jgi:cytochrome P450
MLSKQVREVSEKPSLLEDAPHPIIYHHLLDPDAHKSRKIPSPASLYDEAQALLFGGTDTVANALMIGTFHILDNPDTLRKLKEELLVAWPEIGQIPKYEELEKLPYLV